MSVKTFAAIDVGSFEVSMKIVEFSGKNKSRVLEHLRQRISLGYDTYNKGKISNERMEELCRTLKEFAAIMKTYQVDDYKAYGTSAIRETENTSMFWIRLSCAQVLRLSLSVTRSSAFWIIKRLRFLGRRLIISLKKVLLSWISVEAVFRFPSLTRIC